MELKSFTIQLSSPRPDVLKDFYRDVVGLEEDPVVGGFKINGGHLLIAAHSEVSGPNVEPARFLLNFFVSDIDAEQERLQSKGIRFIRDKGREYWGGIISTFSDPDGNYCQLIEFRPEEEFSGAN